MENEIMRNVDFTAIEAVHKLVAAAYQEPPPNPYYPSPEVQEAARTLNNAFRIPGVEIVVGVWQDVQETPDWRPEFASTLLSYLLDNLPDEEADQRYDELKKGATPNKDELIEFDRAFWEDDQSFVICPTYSIYKVDCLLDSEDNFQGKTTCFVICGSIEFLQNADFKEAYGPFLDFGGAAEAFFDEQSPLVEGLMGTLEISDAFNDYYSAVFKKYQDEDMANFLGKIRKDL